MIERNILTNLVLGDHQFIQKSIPYLEPNYFSNRTERILMEEIKQYFFKYIKQPTKNILKIQIESRTDISDSELKNIHDYINDHISESIVESNLDWLLQKTEKFCKDQAIYKAILNGIAIIDGKDKQHTRDAIPNMLSEALAVSFDSNIGHDYIEDIDNRYQFFHKKEYKIPFDIDFLNIITSGGLSRKSLNVILAGTGAGKSLYMCHVAAAAIKQGYNVLYITLEMAEERIAERIDANILSIDIDQIPDLSQSTYKHALQKSLHETGKLYIKEYPTAIAHSGHFRALIEELKIKKSFMPDLLIVDYLNICASARMKLGTSVNTYVYVKAIAEELRSLAVEYNVPVLTATQTTRTGYDASDIGLTDTSESIGLPATADLLLALIRTEELDASNHIIIKQLKNRYADPSMNKKFLVGIDRAKMKLFNSIDQIVP